MARRSQTWVLIQITIALGLVCLCVGCRREKRPWLVLLVNQVWDVDSQGQIVPFHYEFPKAISGSLQGSTLPLPSPDGRWIAFGDFGGDYDAHLLDTSTLHQDRITRLGLAPRINTVEVQVMIAGWSYYSRHLLLFVAPGEDTSEEGDLKIPAACYGFRDYDIASRKLIGMSLPKEFQFVAWLPDGRLLGLVPGPSPCESKLVTFSVRDGRESQIGPPLVNAGQMKASPDYQWVFGVLGIGECKDSQDQEIAKINLRTGKATVLIPSAPWAANQWPALSPDRQHFSYMHQSGLVNGVPQMSLFVDNRRIYFCPGLMDYQWAGNRHIALACIKSQRPLAGDVMTLDVNTGKTLFRRGL